MIFRPHDPRMTTDLVQGVRAGRHMTAGMGERPVAPEEELAIYGRGLAGMGEAAFGSWPAGRRRELGLIRTHLAPILSRQALAASFARESFHRREPATADTARARLVTSPVLAAYATRWLELADL
jgi:hypothetical protein